MSSRPATCHARHGCVGETLSRAPIARCARRPAGARSPSEDSMKIEMTEPVLQSNGRYQIAIRIEHRGGAVVTHVSDERTPAQASSRAVFAIAGLSAE